MNKIDQIKTALSDPACESVTVKHNCPAIRTIIEFKKGDEKLVESYFAESEIESFQVNHASFPDIEEGDTVSALCKFNDDTKITTSAPCEVIRIDNQSGLYFLQNGKLRAGCFYRHQLVLLSKAK